MNDYLCFLAILSKFPISFSCLLSSIYYILGKSPQIASLSFGDTRAFELRQNPEDPVSILRVIYFISKLKQKKIKQLIFKIILTILKPSIKIIHLKMRFD